MEGKVIAVYSTTEFETVLSLEQFSTGAYYLTMKTENSEHVRKIIKQ